MLPHCCTKPWFKKVTHVIFDLDGTILDTETIYDNILKSLAQKYEKEYNDEIRNKRTGLVKTEMARIVVEELQLPVTPEELLTDFKAETAKQYDSVACMPGVENLLRHFHVNNVPMAIATSSTQSQVDLKTQKHKDLFDLFHHVVTSSDPEVKYPKPAPDIFLVCASRFPEYPKPEQCLVFEDSLIGVQGALAAGMQVIMVPPSWVPYESWKLATLRIDSLDCMVPELFGLPRYGAENETTEGVVDATEESTEGVVDATGESPEGATEVIEESPEDTNETPQVPEE